MSGGTTVLWDTFDLGHLDKEKWNQEIACWGGGNGEFQMYTNEGANTYVKNGELYLRPTYTADHKDIGHIFRKKGELDVFKQWGSCTHDDDDGRKRTGNNIPPIMSSKLISKASISHGRVEVQAKLPKGDWIFQQYGYFLMGGHGNMVAGQNLAMEVMTNAVTLSAPPSTLDRINNTDMKDIGGRKTKYGSWGDDYHTYSLDWTADQIRMDVDDQPIFQWDTPSEGYWAKYNFDGSNIWSSGGRDAPFDIKFSLILNVAVGGKYFRDGWENEGYVKPWNNMSSNADAMVEFWKKRDQWQPTWDGEETAMKIRSAKMVQY